MTRAPSHRYVDPLDQVWLTTAERIGFRVERRDDAYASSDGRMTLTIAAGDLDPDDCLAQMIFHEMCHSLIEGEESFGEPDWGLDNMSDKDVPREHACLRLQAALATPYGLRRALAPTTEFRSFYDALADDPLSPRHEPTTVLAIFGLQRADKHPWAPHLADALAATAEIATRAAAFAPRAKTDDELAGLWSTVEPAVPRHPVGLRGWPAADGRTCGTCAWRTSEDRCRQADLASVDAELPGCERWEPSVDCLTCGACCRAAYHSVTVRRDDPVVKKHPNLLIDRGGYIELARNGDRCVALTGGTFDSNESLSPYHCTIYGSRPTPCREFAENGEHCLTARRRVGLSR